MTLGDDVLLLPVTELSARIKSRRLSPVELTEAYLERIRTHAGRYNAFAHVTPELALEQARAAEAEIAHGKYRGPLHGIPYGAKDLFAASGFPTEWGSAACAGQQFDFDATVIRKLREAGAVLLGKLAMVEFAGGLGYRFANASASGPGRNPWDPGRWTGGSSSGSGAAVAAGLAPFALGTETWGSILCPSAFCGLTGLRPTYGRVSRAGAMVCAWTFDKVGPLCHTAADCRLVLQAIAGPDPDDLSAATEPAHLSKGSTRPAELRGAIVELDFSKVGEPEVKAAFDRAVAELRGAGLQLETAKLPDYPASEIAGLLITVEALSSFENFYADGGVSKLKDRYARWQPEINGAIGGADVVKAWRMRAELQALTAKFFERYDFIVTPNFMSVAPPIEEDLNKALPYSDPMGAIGNACGLPAIALPCGFGKDRMPAGFQIVAAPWDEAMLLDLGDLYQSRTTFHAEHPSLA